ncbi:Rieske 2Fe-2S domain-containing protein [Actinomycetospora sp. TBRC 11914]|uniref:Rieske 2Fe-2S domain-containing protein n=1 Tax=Actinomycetospora sp. TBRC 11914 TaxID=2729387 RepID=UPI00145E717A|nr:Rieske 2Fe-2S domain-containing protein [Actinomycetospora sp. TBRC 11914]NMO91582.1 Rieske 2Fe-2S domain-containing protein [Actinomycetospora sp. TBRC 11914]
MLQAERGSYCSVPQRSDHYCTEAAVVGTAQKFVALNPAYPRSWWIVAWSSDVEPGQVIPARLLERDVVLWRESDGRLHCMSAVCAHLGANLGVGGEVVDNRIQCPFHGWRYDDEGRLTALGGPGKPRSGVCLPTYQIIERHGGVFLWNGADEPDIAFPDLLGQLGVSEDDVHFTKHRWLLPYPAKHFCENNSDGAHFPLVHDTGGWGESVMHDETPTMIRAEHKIHDARPWWSFANVLRRVRKREIGNIVAPVTGDLVTDSYGATLYTVRLSGRPGVTGSALYSFTPVEENSFYVMEMMLMPRLKIPLVDSVFHYVLDHAMEFGSWTLARQEAAVMMHRHEPERPPYSSYDRATVAFRRMWDGRIDSRSALDGTSVRHNGQGAGIRVKKVSTPDDLDRVEGSQA